ncbi:MAG: hypothetical protein LKI53_07805 [Bacteroidales bacterium]|jgi:V/A-type H+-transporting ATPase subunit E|nr:hypothetical protein [Bacteroidales bacterium]
MENKLQALTDKLYEEGLSKGKHEAEEMKAQAEKEADKIISDAKKQAGEILEKARRESTELQEKTASDIKMASGQLFTSVKQKLEQVILTKAVKEPVAAAMDNTEFMKSVLMSIISAFNPKSSQPSPLNIILPEKMQSDLDSFLKNDILSICGKGTTVIFDKRINTGFKIGPGDGGYVLSFTDKDFEEIISEFLRPKTRKILFEES